MLLALAALRDREAAEARPIDLRCIHVEHGIRPPEESRGDAECVRALCETLKVPCRIASVKPGKIAEVAKARGIGIEAAARLYRRRAWFREVRRIQATSVRILVAHTADDMLETALMQIFRGAGPSGLAAMPARRGRILRPLLALTRSNVQCYLAEKNIPWREDATNADTQFLRNRIRHNLIPALTETFPQWHSGITALAETQSLAADFMRNEAERRVEWSFTGNSEHPDSFSFSFSLSTNAESFFSQPLIIREEALFQGIDRLLAESPLASRTKYASIRRKNIRRFSQGRLPAADLGPVRLHKDLHQVTISLTPQEAPLTPDFRPSESSLALLIKTPGSYNLNTIDIEVSECPANNHDGSGFLSPLPLVLRPCFKEDCMVGRQKLKSSERIFSAVDTCGVAAFFGLNGLLVCRDEAALSAVTDSGPLYRVTMKNRSNDV